MRIYIPGIELQKPQLTDGPRVYSAYILMEPGGRAAIVVDNEDGFDSTEYSLVNVPPHGDLIDRTEAIVDANERAYDFWSSDAETDAAVKFLQEQVSIIPAEEA